MVENIFTTKKQKILEHSDHEKMVWGEIFRKELEKDSQQKFSSYWWKYYYEQILIETNKIFTNKKNLNVLEAGSGSGKATLLSFPDSSITLLDISPEGLSVAKRLAESYKINKVKYVEGNMFFMPFDNEKFDLVWNIGAIEHYDEELIFDLISEMFRVSKKNGYVAVAIPNFKSLPIKKATLLANSKFKKFLSFIPGYRLDTEKFYKHEDIENIFKKVANSKGIILSFLKTIYLGSPLIVEAPKILINMFSKIESFFNKSKFLMLIIVKKE